jgi:mycothiol synthase
MTTIELRPVRPDDFEEICALHQRSQRFDGVPQILELDELEGDLDGEHVVLATDTRLVEVDGELAGYAYTFHLPSDVREERCYIFGTVDPAHRRRGAGTALLEWGIRRGSAQLRSSGRSLPCFVRADAYDFIEGAHRLFAKVGMQPVRYYDQLLRPLETLPDRRAVPGVRIVPWPDGRDEEIRHAKNAAFADHWGSTPTSPHHWEQMVHGYGARPDLSFIAIDEDGRVVGHCLNSRIEADDAAAGRSDGWIDNLGTVREWRGRGIASAFIVESLHAFAGVGFTHASIEVDSENPTGAARLYRSLGFEPVQRKITHQIELG